MRSCWNCARADGRCHMGNRFGTWWGIGSRCRRCTSRILFDTFAIILSATEKCRTMIKGKVRARILRILWKVSSAGSVLLVSLLTQFKLRLSAWICLERKTFSFCGLSLIFSQRRLRNSKGCAWIIICLLAIGNGLQANIWTPHALDWI